MFINNEQLNDKQRIFIKDLLENYFFKKINEDEINIEAFIDVINNELSKENESYPLISKKSSENLLQIINHEEPIKSKSSLIIERLKKIKDKAVLKKDNETIEDVNWILQNFVEKNLNEPEIDIKNIDGIYNNEKQNHVNYLMNYSKNATFKRRESDLKLVKMKNSSFSQNNSVILNATQ